MLMLILTTQIQMLFFRLATRAEYNISSGGFQSDMMNSHTTFTIGTSHQFLEDIEFPEEDVIKFDSSTYLSKDEASDDRASSAEEGDVVTPLIEFRSFVNDAEEEDPDQCLACSSELEVSSTSKEFEGVAAMPLSYDSVDSSADSHTESLSANKAALLKPAVVKRNRAKSAMNKSRPSEPSTDGTVRKEERPKRPKKPSVREYQNSPVQQRPPKKTQPTRTQLLMEQIKASIAAEKNKPKKEIKSRLGPLLASPVVRKSAESRPSGITAKENHSKVSISPNAKRRRNEPLKAVNNIVNPSSMTPQRCPKSRQSLLPSKTSSKSEKLCTSKSNVNDRSQTRRSQKDSDALSLRKVILVFLCSSLTLNYFTSGTGLYQPSTSSQHSQNKTSVISEAAKIAQLRGVAHSFTAIAVALRYMSEKNDVLTASLHKQNEYYCKFGNNRRDEKLECPD
uniref:TPX2_importin domain-containing protein n=1 Tax=Syphacia muris TaxID=451379 RepID=A0A158R591_9BILA